MRYYNIINMRKQGKGQITVNEKSLALLEKMTSMKGQIKVIGECDSSGKLLSEIKAGNFLNKQSDAGQSGTNSAGTTNTAEVKEKRTRKTDNTDGENN